MSVTLDHNFPNCEYRGMLTLENLIRATALPLPQKNKYEHFHAKSACNLERRRFKTSLQSRLSIPELDGLRDFFRLYNEFTEAQVKLDKHSCFSLLPPKNSPEKRTTTTKIIGDEEMVTKELEVEGSWTNKTDLAEQRLT